MKDGDVQCIISLRRQIEIIPVIVTSSFFAFILKLTLVLISVLYSWLSNLYYLVSGPCDKIHDEDLKKR